VNDDQKKVSEALIDQLRKKGFDIATKLTKATTFWNGEGYHQDYYLKKGSNPYCHGYVKRF
jgi:peptide methionine sulfoxide reductase msrA/msrB